MKSQKPIALFDSGVGGLSILLEIQKILPNETTIFLADQKNIPYGKKTQQQLKEITSKITQFLIRHETKLLVIACNTATCYTIDHLRANFDIPIIGTVPAIKSAAKISKKSKIAVLSTKATAKSLYVKSLIKSFAKGVDVTTIECPGLEQAVETLNEAKIDKLLENYAGKIIEYEADVAVLGCTHYPLVKKKLSKLLGTSVKIIDSGPSIAKQAQKVLKNLNILSSKKNQDLYFTTGRADLFSKISSSILAQKITATNVSL